jgi:glycosyltransferase involved in cell wall biosynthesis
MNLSVVIPARNSQDVLPHCLDAIYRNSYQPSEVIVVDCNSDTDAYSEAIKPYPVTVIEAGEGGKGNGRNLGISAAQGEIIVLIDADIVIPADAFERVIEQFKSHPDVDTINGLLSEECPHQDFYSQYKNLYMNYRFKRMPEDIDFLFTSFTAFRSSTAIIFRDSIKPKDTETGQKMAKEEGRKILFDSRLEVVHWKKYNFFKLLHNDFIVPYGWAKIFWRFKGLKDVATKGRFAHSTNDQIFSVVAVFLAVVSLVHPMFYPIFLIGTAAFFLLNLGFFAYLRRSKGLFYSLRGIAFTYLDNFVMGVAIAYGFGEVLLEQLNSLYKAGKKSLRAICGVEG